MGNKCGFVEITISGVLFRPCGCSRYLSGGPPSDPNKEHLWLPGAQSLATVVSSVSIQSDSRQEEEERPPTLPSEAGTEAKVTPQHVPMFSISAYELSICPASSAFLRMPAKHPQKDSLSLCCPRINLLLSYFIFPFC